MWGAQPVSWPNEIAGNDGFTKLLLHCEGTDEGTTFTDSSASGHTATPSGNANTETSDFKFGASCLELDGSGDFLSVADSTDWTWAGLFTVDFWIKTSTATQDTQFRTAFAIGDGAGTGTFVLLFRSGGVASANMSLYHNAAERISGNISAASGAWVHVLLSRDGASDWRLFINGVQSGSTYNSNASLDSTGLVIGKYPGLAGHILGLMDEIRVSKDIAREVAAFTPPSAPYG